MVPTLGFQRSSLSALAPPAAVAANLAWDEADREAILFGGNSSEGPLNATWAFDGVWTNVTNRFDAPPARFGGAMDYDEQSQEVVLFGGCGVIQCPLGDTWTFKAGIWTNETATLGVDSPAPTYDASLVDFADEGAMLFGGCLLTVCASQTNATELFGTNATCTTDLLPDPCWIPHQGPGPSPRAGAALGYYPADGDVVLYGGYSGPCVGCWHDLNDTWTFNSTTGWQNLSSQLIIFSGFYPSAGRAYASFFYDPTSRLEVLYGGYNHSTLSPYAQIWAFYVGANDSAGWADVSAYAQPPARERPAVAPSSLPGQAENFPGLLVGGAVGAIDQNDTWVFEYGILLSPRVFPVPAETNQSVSFFANATGGARPSLQWQFGDGTGSLGGNVTHAYLAAKTYTATLITTDAWGVQNSTTVSVDVRLPIIVLALPPAIDSNVNATFNATLQNGTSPYTFTWNISGHPLTSHKSVRFRFASPGPVQGSVSVTDGTGTTVSLAFVLTVNPPLIAAPTFTPSAPRPGASVNFSSGATGGTPPYTYAWRFGDGSSSNLSAPSHSYGYPKNYTVQLWVNDSLQASSEYNLSVVVKLTSPTTKTPFSIDWASVLWLILAVVLVVGVVIVLAVYGRRRPPTAVSRGPTPPSALEPWTPPGVNPPRVGAPPSGPTVPPR